MLITLLISKDIDCCLNVRVMEDDMTVNSISSRRLIFIGAKDVNTYIGYLVG